MVTGMEVGEVGVEGEGVNCLLCVYGEVNLLQVNSLMSVKEV